MAAAYEVIIIGGSYAGLSAAMALGRSLRQVLIVDSGEPCNAPTPHSHNFLTQDGSRPSEISRIAREQVSAYETVTFFKGLATKGGKTTDGFDVHVETGERFSAAKLIFATGIRDQLPNIAGFAACWGKSAIHCPYCHGYEFRGKSTAVLGKGEPAMHYALLVGNLTRNLTILTNGQPDFSEEQTAKLREHNITVVETEVSMIEHTDGNLENVIFKDGRKLSFDALYYKPAFQQHCRIPAALGCGINEQGYIVIDQFQKTTVDGVYACGDNSSAMRAVANAVAAGNLTGAAVNKQLAGERF
ncbi:MAG TPA: NAD(P)/FAD-dependent oxidoreductase [Cyclobacteriaceae bacterium]|nr:NAD(P)/FAD-dependent oxidoreductase [Cyclobacteriaceae bacterium]